MTLEIKNYPAPTVSKKEILRYAGGGDASVAELIDRCFAEIEKDFTYKAAKICLPVSINGDTLDFSLAQVKSHDLAKCLSGCRKAIIFAATVGFAADRAILKYSTVSPAKALIFQAIGAERIESLCDLISAEYKDCTPRFSPGYGDLDISFQKDIFRILNCEKSIGVALNDSLLMMPSKSVTAIFGLKE